MHLNCNVAPGKGKSRLLKVKDDRQESAKDLRSSYKYQIRGVRIKQKGEQARRQHLLLVANQGFMISARNGKQGRKEGLSSNTGWGRANVSFKWQ